MGYNGGIDTKIISLAKLSLLSKAIAHSICIIVGQPASSGGEEINNPLSPFVKGEVAEDICGRKRFSASKGMRRTANVLVMKFIIPPNKVSVSVSVKVFYSHSH